ncbi:MAG: hypothetical protein JO116_21135 [Planctomycetaceae bacterium]|nr:hypothetical protein [Planctomycetaceae bacterium]
MTDFLLWRTCLASFGAHEIGRRGGLGSVDAVISAVADGISGSVLASVGATGWVRSARRVAQNITDHRQVHGITQP